MGHVLVVDDSSTVRVKIARAVERLGHEVTAVDSGRAALNLLRSKRHDVVLLDILMPDMDGFEVLAALKADERTKQIPVIVISSLGDTMTSVVRAMELGAEDFLPKTFELPLLKTRLATSVEKSLRQRAKPEVAIRAASANDIPILLSFVNTAGAGLPFEAWKRSCTGSQSPWERGEEIMRDATADIHFGNCWIGQTASGGLGGLVLYSPPLPDSPSALPKFDFLRPLQELEGRADGTAHVSFLCTIDSWRGEGIGSALLRFAESRRGPKGMSIIVASSNNGARALYTRFGYAEAERRPMVLPDGGEAGDDWILMFKA